MRKKKLTHIPEVEAVKILNAYKFPILKYRMVTNVEEALEAADDIGYPVAMKVVSPDIIHKLDVGGVKIGIGTPNDLLEAFVKMKKKIAEKAPGAEIWGFNIQKMADKGQEVIIGMNRESKFGPIIMFGLGGSMVEALKDVTFRLAPLRKLSAQNMISQIRAHKLLEAFRGSKPKDIKALEEMILRVSQLVMDFPEIRELDMNPVIVYDKGKGCNVADARIIIE
jgi:acyl-CoA synthetase (NDP forming)